MTLTLPAKSVQSKAAVLVSFMVIVPDVAKGFVPAVHEAGSFQSLITTVSGPSVKLSAKGDRSIKPIPLTMLKGLI